MKLPYLSFLGLVIKENGVETADTLLIKPNPRIGLDNDVVNKMHYYQDSRNNGYYDNGDFWFYDDVVIPAESSVEMVDAIRVNLNNEEVGSDGDTEMGDTEDGSDSDYDPNNAKVPQGVDMSQVLASISDLKAYMTQRFNDQDYQFQEINH